MLLLPLDVHVSMKEVGDVEAAISRSRDRNIEKQQGGGGGGEEASGEGGGGGGLGGEAGDGWGWGGAGEGEEGWEVGGGGEGGGEEEEERFAEFERADMKQVKVRSTCITGTKISIFRH
jgi:hypothetical protein